MSSSNRFFIIDLPITLIILALCALGLLAIFSTTYLPHRPFSPFFIKQLIGMGIGFFLYLTASNISWVRSQRWGYFLYILTLILLFITLAKGSIGMGAKRWINMGVLKFQPSELAKLFFPLFFVHHLFMHHLVTDHNQRTYKNTFYPVFGVMALSFFLIVKQPDLGTALIILISGTGLLFLAGLPRRFFIAAALCTAISAPLVWTLLHDYQKKRIMVFLGAGDQKKERYHIEQSQIAIGSGGLFGKGLLQGTQNHLQFLPESRTDFIFSVICEEGGFIGAVIVLALYLLLCSTVWTGLQRIESFYASLLACGLILPILCSVLVNIGMVVGLLPIVGIPLPFVSYGLTNLWINFLSIGIVCNILQKE